MTIKAWIERRELIRQHFVYRAENGGGAYTADEIREYLARYKRIRVTVDTIQRDLREMERVGTLVSGKHPTKGHTMGNGSWIAYNGWRINDGSA